MLVQNALVFAAYFLLITAKLVLPASTEYNRLFASLNVRFERRKRAFKVLHRFQWGRSRDINYCCSEAILFDWIEKLLFRLLVECFVEPQIESKVRQRRTSTSQSLTARIGV